MVVPLPSLSLTMLTTPFKSLVLAFLVSSLLPLPPRDASHCSSGFVSLSAFPSAFCCLVTVAKGCEDRFSHPPQASSGRIPKLPRLCSHEVRPERKGSLVPPLALARPSSFLVGLRAAEGIVGFSFSFVGWSSLKGRGARFASSFPRWGRTVAFFTFANRAH